MSIVVSIVEDDARVRDSLAGLIDRSPGFRCVSQYPSAESAIEELPRVNPAVVLMDINLPGMSGVECVCTLKELLPDTQIVMLTVYEDTDLIASALAAGATGYLLKQTPSTELLASIREVHNGGSPMTSHIARKVVQLFQHHEMPVHDASSLSPREQEVLDYLAKGYIYEEVALALGISFDTVHTYIRRIFEKLHVHSRTEAVARHLRPNRSVWPDSEVDGRHKDKD
jgi:DNA-binding NarL/FixJ family response regulator